MQVAALWSAFTAEFTALWQTERRGILYEARLYEDQGHAPAAAQALADLLAQIWRDTLGFAGVEMHRRILGLAHNADFERIPDEPLRVTCEARALVLGQRLMLGAATIPDIAAVTALTRTLNGEDHR